MQTKRHKTKLDSICSLLSTTFVEPSRVLDLLLTKDDASYEIDTASPHFPTTIWIGSFARYVEIVLNEPLFKHLCANKCFIEHLKFSSAYSNKTGADLELDNRDLLIKELSHVEFYLDQEEVHKVTKQCEINPELVLPSPEGMINYYLERRNIKREELSSRDWELLNRLFK